MKKIFTLLSVMIALATGASAQHCSASYIAIPPHMHADTPGLSPKSAELPCIDSGSYVSDTIFFQNYDTFNVGFRINIVSLKIDAITNLPAGLCWVMDTASNTFGPGQTGVIYVNGTCTAPPGQYKMKIIIDLNTNVFNVRNKDVDSLFMQYHQPPLSYFIRVKRPGTCCFGLDTINGKTHYYVTDSVSTGPCTNDINEPSSAISGLSINPNPFSSAAVLTFTTRTAGKYMVSMRNILGSEVMTQEINVSAGSQELALERKQLSPGVYLVSISDGTSSITRKVTVE
jgi:hypothetical protein